MKRLAVLCALLVAVAPSTARASDAAKVRVVRDVVYLPGANYADGKDKLDLYLPANRASGMRSPGIVIIHGGGWRGGDKGASREINIGGGDMTQAVARRLGVEGYEAEAIKRSSENHELEVNSAIAPVLEDLVGELSLSLDYVEHHEGVHVEQVLLSGGGVMAPGAVQYIEQATGRSARTWNPLEGLRVDSTRVDTEELEAWASTLVVALGLASRVRAA